MHPKHVEKLIGSSKISAEERKILSAKLEPEPKADTYDSSLDAELEHYLTRVLLPRHERPADYWPSLGTVVGRIYAVLAFGGFMGYIQEQAESSLTDMLAVLAFTKSRLIARKASEAVRDLIEPRYLIPEPLRAQALAALAKYEEQFPENGQGETTDGQ